MSEPMLTVRRVVREQYVLLPERMWVVSREDGPCRLRMNASGVGPFVARTYRAAVDEPARFRQSRAVDAHVGLAPRPHRASEMDRLGYITRNGDGTIRSALFEALLLLLRPDAKPSAPKARGQKLAKRRGRAGAMIAVARLLAVILHRIWVDGTTVRFSAEVAASRPVTEIRREAKRSPTTDRGSGRSRAG